MGKLDNNEPADFESKEDYFGSKEDYFGSKEDYFGSKEDYFGSKEDYFGSKEDYFGSKEDYFGSKEDDFGFKEDDFGFKEDDFGFKEDDFGFKEDDFGFKEDDFGFKEDDFGSEDNSVSKGIISLSEYRLALGQVFSQGTCGSCWAHVAASMIETAQLNTNNILQYVSRQAAMDCFGGGNCQGGRVDVVLKTIIGRSGKIPTMASYPYLGRSQTCRINSSDVEYAQVRVKTFKYLYKDGKLTFTDEKLTPAVVKNWIATYGPIGILLKSDPILHQFSGGIIDSNNPGFSGMPDKACMLVGWDDKAFIIQNTWGEDWGEKGYCRVTQDSIYNVIYSAMAITVHIQKTESVSQNLLSSSVDTLILSSEDNLRALEWHKDQGTISYLAVANGKTQLLTRSFDGKTFGSEIKKISFSSSDNIRGWSWDPNKKFTSYLAVVSGKTQLITRSFDGTKFGSDIKRIPFSSGDNIRGWSWDLNNNFTSYLAVVNGKTQLITRSFDGTKFGSDIKRIPFSSGDKIRSWSWNQETNKCYYLMYNESLKQTIVIHNPFDGLNFEEHQ